MLVVTRLSFPTFPSVGPFTQVQAPRPKGESGQYLLDGHQRLSTLVGFLGRGLAADPPIVPESELPEDEMWEWNLHFDLDATSEDRFVLPRSARQPLASSRYVPLMGLLDANRLMDIVLGLRTAGRTPAEVNRIVQLADRIRNYEVPVVTMASDETQQITTGFKRVNSAGTVMSDLHMVKALSWTPGFNLEERISELANELSATRWRAFGRDWLLDLARMSAGLSFYKSSPERMADALRSRPEILVEARDALAVAIETLANVDIHGPQLLPYGLQAILLALVAPAGRSVDPDRLDQWIDATTYCEIFSGSGATEGKIRQARLHLEKWLSDGAGCPTPDPVPVEPYLRFDWRSARAKGQVRMLARPLGEGALLEVADRGSDALNRPTLHARTPAGERAAKGLASRFVAFGQAPLELCDGRWEVWAPELHMIPEDAYVALRDEGDEDRFLILRDRYIRGAEADRVRQLGLQWRGGEE